MCAAVRSGQAGAPQDLNERLFPFDPEASRRLLREAGYSDGERATLPWLLLLVRFFTPATPLIAFSSGSVICDSMISALAPG